MLRIIRDSQRSGMEPLPISGAIGPHPVRFYGVMGAGGEGSVYAARIGEHETQCGIKLTMSAGATAVNEEMRVIRDLRLQERSVRYAALPLHGQPLPITMTEGPYTYDTHCMVMRRYERGALEQCIEDAGPPRRRFSAADTAGVLAMSSLCLRDAGVVHGDLKPLNILVAQDGTIAITDWSTARPRGHMVNGWGSEPCTPMYMAPEMVRAHERDERHDTYAAACIGWEMMTGRTRQRTHQIVHAVAVGADEVLRYVENDRSVFSGQRYGEPYMMAVLNQAHTWDPKDRSSHLDLLTDLAPYQSARALYSPPDWEAIGTHLMLRTAVHTQRNPLLDVTAARAIADHWGGDPQRQVPLSQLADALDAMHPALAGRSLFEPERRPALLSTVLAPAPQAEPPHSPDLRQYMQAIEAQITAGGPGPVPTTAVDADLLRASLDQARSPAVALSTAQATKSTRTPWR